MMQIALFLGPEMKYLFHNRRQTILPLRRSF